MQRCCLLEHLYKWMAEEQTFSPCSDFQASLGISITLDDPCSPNMLLEAYFLWSHIPLAYSLALSLSAARL